MSAAAMAADAQRPELWQSSATPDNALYNGFLKVMMCQKDPLYPLVNGDITMGHKHF